MLALRKFETVDRNGKVQIDIPQEFGNKVEILILPVGNVIDLQDDSVDVYFLNKAFEDDPSEDAVWEKYISGKK